MDILIVEDEILLGLMLADTLADVGHRVLGPASGRAEALGLVSDRIPHLAFVDTPAPTVVPCATAGSLGPSAAAISVGIAPRTDQGPADSGVLEALAG